MQIVIYITSANYYYHYAPAVQWSLHYIIKSSIDLAFVVVLCFLLYGLLFPWCSLIYAYLLSMVLCAFSEFLAKESNDHFWNFVTPISQMQLGYIDCKKYLCYYKLMRNEIQYMALLQDRLQCKCTYINTSVMFPEVFYYRFLWWIEPHLFERHPTYDDRFSSPKHAIDTLYSYSLLQHCKSLSKNTFYDCSAYVLMLSNCLKRGKETGNRLQMKQIEKQHDIIVELMFERAYQSFSKCLKFESACWLCGDCTSSRCF